MKILNKVERVKCGLVIDTYKGGTKGAKLKAAATEAALKGMGSAEWKNYMTIFADSKEQLARLTGDDSHAPYVRQMSAYLVANGTCGGETPHNLAQGIDESIDDDLDVPTDTTFKPYIDFPPIP